MKTIYALAVTGYLIVAILLFILYETSPEPMNLSEETFAKAMLECSTSSLLD